MSNNFSGDQDLRKDACDSRNELSVPQIKLLGLVNPLDAPKIAESLKSVFEISAFHSSEEAITPEIRDCLFDLYRLIPLVEAIGKGGVA